MKSVNRCSKWAAVKLSTGTVHLIGFIEYEKSNEILWATTACRGYMSDDMEVLKLYDADLMNYDESVAALSKQFDLDFPPLSAIRESAGWLAPDGKFYPCDFLEHYFLAIRLSLLYYDDDKGATTLERRGWVHIQNTGEMLLHYGKKFTNAQKNTVMDIIAVSTDSQYIHGILRDLNYFSDKD